MLYQSDPISIVLVYLRYWPFFARLYLQQEQVIQLSPFLYLKENLILVGTPGTYIYQTFQHTYFDTEWSLLDAQKNSLKWKSTTYFVQKFFKWLFSCVPPTLKILFTSSNINTLHFPGNFFASLSRRKYRESQNSADSWQTVILCDKEYYLGTM